jgi:hypothetical protein
MSTAPHLNYTAAASLLIDEGLTPNPRNPELSIACARKLLEKNAHIEAAERDLLLAAERADGIEAERDALAVELQRANADRLRLARKLLAMRNGGAR